MAERKVTIVLSPGNTGLTLNAQLVDNSGVNYGGAISTGFVELGGGVYFLNHDFDDAFVGGIQVYEQGVPGTILAGAGIDYIDLDRQRSEHITAGSIAESYNSIINGAAVAGTLNNEEMTTDLTNTISGSYVDRVVIWITGTLTGQASRITEYNGTTFQLTYDPVTASPLAGDRFIIV